MSQRKVDAPFTRVVVSFSDGVVRCIDPGYTHFSPYEIARSRIDNPTKLVWWLHHMNEKSWWTRDHESQLIEVVMVEICHKKMYEGQG
jgi:hypothetical protein